jgi:hypothetical protein
VRETESAPKAKVRDRGIGVGRTRALMLWTIFFGILIPVLVVVFYKQFLETTETPVNRQTEQLAAELAGGPVQPLTGPQHTVYYSALALPSASAPRADGRATLVWFSSTDCRECELMEAFVFTTAAQFAQRLVFQEKPTERDSTAQRYGVSTLPAFVLLDAQGKELGRFGYESDAGAFEAAIAGALGP